MTPERFEQETDRMITDLERDIVIASLIECLEESHRDEIENDHYGDDSCSYCDLIERAKALIYCPTCQPITG